MTTTQMYCNTTFIRINISLQVVKCYNCCYCCYRSLRFCILLIALVASATSFHV